MKNLFDIRSSYFPIKEKREQIEYLVSLSTQNYSLDDFQEIDFSDPSLQSIAKLLSDEGLNYIEETATISEQLTREHFGSSRSLYIPLYLSNVCHNICTYCGFSVTNRYKRVTLSKSELEEELHSIVQRGYRHLLLVTGERVGKVANDYLIMATSLAKKAGLQSISVEYGSYDYEFLKDLRAAGADTFVLYQETYHEEFYKSYHLHGNKSDFYGRLQSYDRAIKAGFKKISIGFLAGLAPYPYDFWGAYFHLLYLKKEYWDVTLQLSIPRMNDASGVSNVPFYVNDKRFAQMLFLYRILFPVMPIFLSTREGIRLRDNLSKIVVTNLSVESKTSPGIRKDWDSYESGRACSEGDLKQFEISDERSLPILLSDLKKIGLDPFLKDWQMELNQ